MKKSSGAAINIFRIGKPVVKRQSEKKILNVCLPRCGTGWQGNYEEILMPLLAGLKAVPRDPKQEREIRKLNYQIEELRKQSYMLRQGPGGRQYWLCCFYRKAEPAGFRIETLIHRRQLLEADQFFEQEIMQTEYLLTVFRSRPTRMENYEEEAFLMIIDHATVYPGQKTGSA